MGEWIAGAGTRQNAADKKPSPVNENDVTSTAADMRAMAEQAEEEAAEAEALAAAARARARAIQLRRQAELADASEKTPKKDSETTVATTSEKEADTAAHEPKDADPVAQTEVIAPETEPEDVPTQSVATEEVVNDTVVDGAAQTPADSDAVIDVTAEQPERKTRWRRPTLSVLAASLAVVVILAALAAGVYMVPQHRNASRERQRAAEFSAAARQGVVTLTSLDFNDAKQGVQRILDDSTGSFKDDFQKMAADFTKVVEQSQVVEHGTVQAAAVDLDSMTNDSAVVLVASTSEVSNAAGAKQDPRSFRLIVTLTRDGDQLKMSKVEFVP